MKKNLKIAIGTDVFPPTTDGISNVVQSYANILNKNHCEAVVVTPKNPNQQDKNYPYEIFRYKSWWVPSKEGYSVGWPFKKSLSYDIINKNFDLLHSHAPLATSYYFRLVNRKKRIPTVLTYHTAYETEIKKRIPIKRGRTFAYHFLLNNINCADEVWVTSRGTEKSLREIGYTGDFVVMPNGCDMTKSNVNDDEIKALREKYNIENNVPILIYTGRMVWYKNIRLILDACKIMKDCGKEFKLILLGFGVDEKAIKKYYKKLGLCDNIIWTGKILDRDIIKDYYLLSDLLLFPSVFDTNGLVVREAAACAKPSILTKGSCAAEDIEDNETGFLCDENAQSLSKKIIEVMNNKELLNKVGQNAQNKIYLSREDAVKRAYERYSVVIDNFYKSKENEKEFEY